MTHRARGLALLLLLVSLAGCDQATKRLAHEHLRGQPPHVLIRGVLELRYAENPAVAFSLLRSLDARVREPLVLGLGLATFALVAALWWRRRRRLDGTAHAALALIVAGALGNLFDRALRGVVIDFVHLRGWPIFNLADVLIVGGALLLAFAAWRGRPRPVAG